MPQGASLLNVLQPARDRPGEAFAPPGPARGVHPPGPGSARSRPRGSRPPADVIRIATSPHLAWSLGIETDSLEGYLFPDTYQVTKGMRVEEILGRMTQRFRDRVGTPEVVARARRRGLTLHQLITLRLDRGEGSCARLERPIIARVFLNRLRAGHAAPGRSDRRLRDVPRRDGRPRGSDLQTDHPLQHLQEPRGLPPGPIGNPGRSTVDAVLEPANARYPVLRRHRRPVALLLDDPGGEHNRAVVRGTGSIGPRLRARPSTLAPADGRML